MGSISASLLFTILAIAMSILRKYEPFNSWVQKQIEKMLMKSNLVSKELVVRLPDFKLVKNDEFSINGRAPGKYGISLSEISETLSNLKEYEIRAKRLNSVISQRANQLNNYRINQLAKINYFEKIQTVDTAIENNSIVLKKIIEHTLNKLLQKNIMDTTNDELYVELNTLCGILGYSVKNKSTLVDNHSPVTLHANTNSNQGRVVETMSHLCRDWSSDYNREIEPLLSFIMDRIDSIEIKPNTKTLIIVPGSGLGKISYSLAKKYPNYTVDSIEWSALMYLVNQFVLEHGENVKIHPFAQHYSSQMSLDKQARPIEVQLPKTEDLPLNLKTLYGDFREYQPLDIINNKIDGYEQIIVVTAYFIDTAENMFEYIESIEGLTNFLNNTDSKSNNKLNWINVGPLKYGTRPLVQLTANELLKLRKLRGWEDLSNETLTDYVSSPLNGYITDYDSLYQGYYGLLRFHSRYPSNDG
ncbi:hypothetical protein Kpol_413p1 [Vanderwaltozyma polyspora DSM 70294]|uniref:Uncharacterized protein n=1 Tax=Vanderwaltozyma polyspora (strain ATCC 22028 / DSM 70294 / BCRC 21397 / CBS 2163 / NBRC 10782 / NRRL Y-8283 / UCD 57-17) TaxID=436907 RepID=A7TRG6_VANPO|nr:uncharacterized protein Kpol_413p1 [Vanderwaltozyma polyspora DSM 70294]EDO15126.1 hypothetical protein Kpol_413p1 [Vanderwaltozyma polyspora DSM 70294]